MGKVKGTVLIVAIKFLRSQKEAGRRATPPELHWYLTERLLPSTWYDEHDYFRLLQAVVKLFRPPPGMDPWEAIGRNGANVHLDSTYRTFVKHGDPVTTLKYFPTLWGIRHDTGKVEVVVDGPGQARVSIRDYTLVSREACKAIQGTIAELLAKSGVENAQIRKTRCRALSGDVCEWDIRWPIPGAAG